MAHPPLSCHTLGNPAVSHLKVGTASPWNIQIQRQRQCNQNSQRGSRSQFAGRHTRRHTQPSAFPRHTHTSSPQKGHPNATATWPWTGAPHCGVRPPSTRPSTPRRVGDAQRQGGVMASQPPPYSPQQHIPTPSKRPPTSGSGNTTTTHGGLEALRPRRPNPDTFWGLQGPHHRTFDHHSRRRPHTQPPSPSTSAPPAPRTRRWPRSSSRHGPSRQRTRPRVFTRSTRRRFPSRTPSHLNTIGPTGACRKSPHA